MTIQIPRRRAQVLAVAGLALGLVSCASTPRQEVAAVVQDESARQAAAETAAAGEGSTAALKKGADAAASDAGEREPPTF